MGCEHFKMFFQVVTDNLGFDPSCEPGMLDPMCVAEAVRALKATPHGPPLHACYPEDQVKILIHALKKIVSKKEAEGVWDIYRTWAAVALEEARIK